MDPVNQLCLTCRKSKDSEKLGLMSVEIAGKHGSILFRKCINHYHAVPHFVALRIYSCGKNCEKRRNCLEQAISSFLTIFCILYAVYGTYFSLSMHFRLSSAICFNLDQSKILLSGNVFSPIWHLFFSLNVL